jgi:hypothetical protein
MPLSGVQGWQAMGKKADQEPLPKANWAVKYSSGSLALKKDQWLKAAFMSRAEANPSKSPAVVVAIDDLREVSFNAAAEKDSDTMQRLSRSGCGSAKGLMPKDTSAHPPEMFAAWITSPGAVKRAAEHLSSRYQVRFLWNDGGVEKELVFTVNSCEYASFLANLRWSAGQRWKDLERKFH